MDSNKQIGAQDVIYFELNYMHNKMQCPTVK
jgi:hypothetical protein